MSPSPKQYGFTIPADALPSSVALFPVEPRTTCDALGLVALPPPSSSYRGHGLFFLSRKFPKSQVKEITSVLLPNQTLDPTTHPFNELFQQRQVFACRGRAPPWGNSQASWCVEEHAREG